MNTGPAPEEGLVVALNHEGEGVVRAGKTAFVAGALPGETVLFERRRRHRQYDEGRLLDVRRRSPKRVEPSCVHFGVCGGCALQHLSPAAQLEAKQAQLAEALERIAKVTPARWLVPLSGPVWNYRRRARLGVRYVIRKGRVVVGFRERLKPYVAELQSCAILASPVNALIEPLARLIEKLTIRDDLPQIEVAVADNATALVLRVLKAPSAADLALLATFAAQYAVRFYMQPGGLETIEPLDETASEALRYRLPAQELQFEFGPSDFIQINAEVNRRLVSAAIELLAPRSDSTVLDLFCGLGNFTLPVARHCHDAVGVDGDAALVARARLNAVHNAITNVAFHAANLFEPQSDAAWRARRYTHVLLDPPRAGAQQLLAEIAAIEPERIVYVSCHPGTLARDTGILVHGHGFELHAAGVIDMFPHTSHLESIVMLEPRARRRAGARP